MGERKATDQDLDYLLKLRLENAKYRSESVVQKPLKMDFFKNHTTECLTDRDCEVFITYDNSETVGYIVGFINKNHPIFDLVKDALIDDFYVKSSNRKKAMEVNRMII
ncbi:hypothetical protein [Tenacibaculum sp. C7A-26P2]|uniref:hypothetical protein n=1 Tax=Tenacibaculum sp. C7A-26P2 TaxID=3447504 RepID=UPI003F83BFE5